MVSWMDCPHLRSEENLMVRQPLIQKYGANSSFIRSFLNGEFQRGSEENKVFTNLDVERIRFLMYGDDGKPPEFDLIPGPRRASADFSGGGDEQTFYVREGNQWILAEYRHEEDTNALATMYAQLLREWEVPPHEFYGDNGGLGKPIIDNMEGNHDLWGIHRYMNNQAPRNPEDYKDRITEDHWHFKELIHSVDVQLRQDPELLRQMRDRRYNLDDHNKIMLEKKQIHRKEFGYSPDRLETIVMLFADWHPIKTADAPPENREELGALENYAVKLTQGEAMGGMHIQPNIFGMMPQVDGMRPEGDPAAAWRPETNQGG
jgi:hypothetical protein